MIAVGSLNVNGITVIKKENYKKGDIGGYFNIGEAIIYFAAILFGPYVGAFAGGVGAGMADFFLGYTNYAPITLVVKALEGFVVGYAFRYLRKFDSKPIKLRSKTVAILLGVPVMVLGYLIAEYYILGYGPAAYLEIPWNLIQCGGGLIIALPLINIIEKTKILQNHNVFS